MSHHRRTAASAHWTCHLCRLSAAPVVGVTAADETALLAAVHDRLHHGGARTAQLLTDELPTILAAAS